MERLTVNEAADKLGISQSAVRKRIQRGTIPNARGSDGSVYVFLDTDTEVVSPEPGTELDDEKVLHYIDKLYSSWQTVSVSVKRVGLVIVVVSLLLLILSGGGASAEQKLTLSGIGLKIPFVVFLIAGAVSLLVLPPTYIYLGGQQREIKAQITKLYGNVGIDKSTLALDERDQQEANSKINPGIFGTGNTVNVFSLTFGRGIVSSIVRIGIYMVIPVAGQVAAGFKVSELLQKQELGWIWVLFQLLAVMTFAAIYWCLTDVSGKQDASPLGTKELVYWRS